MQISDSERAKQQGRRLRALRERRDISKGRLMDALGLTTTNGYDLYERGKSVIRLDRVAEWADAFGISEQEFLDAVLEPTTTAADQDGHDPTWDFRAALHAAKPADPEGAERLYDDLSKAPQDIQKAVISAILDSARRDREEREQGARQAHSVAEQREHYGYRHTG